MNTAKHVMDLQLTKFGPYKVNYSKNGRYASYGTYIHYALFLCSLDLSVNMCISREQLSTYALLLYYRWRTATHTEYRMVVLNLVQRIYHAIKKHLTSSIDEWAVNVRHILWNLLFSYLLFTILSYDMISFTLLFCDIIRRSLHFLNYIEFHS